jgi:hypothetical protein
MKRTLFLLSLLLALSAASARNALYRRSHHDPADLVFVHL